jgi:hypothetical protein
VARCGQHRLHFRYRLATDVRVGLRTMSNFDLWVALVLMVVFLGVVAWQEWS